MFSRRQLPIALAFLLCAACHHRAPTPPALPPIPLPPGTVLLLPPRNVIQDGKPHPVGAQSGAYFARTLQDQFAERGWQVAMPTDSRLSNTQIPPADEAIAEARRVNADYILRIALGEFRDAAPMTFRPDFVTLDAAHLWRAKNAALVWSLPEPMTSSGNNLRHYYRLLDELAENVVEQIADTEIAREALEAPARAAIDPLGPLAVGAAPGTCTTDQILAMKESGLTDDQVRRACGQ